MAAYGAIKLVTANGSSSEIKSIFHHFVRAIIEANKKVFLEGESPTLKVQSCKLKKH